MDDLAEIRAHWRPLLAATLGMASGISLIGTVTSTIAPSLIAANGWSRASFAMIGSLSIIMSFVFPFVGRLADTIGVRRTALIGQVSLPIVYLLYSLFGGSLGIYAAIFSIQSVLCITTTATVYTRLAVRYVTRARGLALAIVASGPAFSGIFVGPLLNMLVEAHGWRAGYQAMAVFAALGGAAAFLLVSAGPDLAPVQARAPAPAHAARSVRDDYRRIARSPAFWILLAAMLLCNLPQTIMLVQLKLVLLAKGVSGSGAGVLLGTLPAGMLLGRFLTGLALDRFVPHVVAFVALVAPGFALLAIAWGWHVPGLLAAAVFCLGFSFGAEGDVMGFLTARAFPIEIYSSVMGLLTCATSLSTATGAAILSVMLARTGNYDPFLVTSGISVMIGAAVLLLLGRGAGDAPDVREDPATYSLGAVAD